MANITIPYPSSNCTPCSNFACGSTVMLCMTPIWKDRTTNGYPFIKATVQCENSTSPCPPSPCPPVNSCGTYPATNYCNPRVIKSLVIDDAQILTNPSTGQKYLIECYDIRNIYDEVCLIEGLMSATAYTYAPACPSTYFVGR